MGQLTGNHIQLPSPNGVGYGEEATMKLQGGLIYQIIKLATNLKVKSTIERITIDIGGTPIAYWSGDDLVLKDKFNKSYEAQGVLTVPFSDFNMRTPEGIHQTALATSVFDDITLKVKFKAKATTDPAILTMRAKAYVSANPAAQLQGGGRTFVPEAYEVTQYAAAAGDHEWIFPNGSANKFAQRMILDESEVKISRVLVKRGLTTIREFTREDIDYDLQKIGEKALQNGKLLLDFSIFGFGKEDALNTSGINFVFTTDAAGAIKTRVEGYRRLTA